MIPFYIMQIDEDDDGMDFMGLVDMPAHMKGSYHFNSSQPKIIKQYFDEEKRIITGVAISVDQPIYRFDDEIGEHYVIFKKADAQKIAIRMMENGYLHNVNMMHDPEQILKDVILFESYFVNDELTNIPTAFENQNLKAGSWIVSYKVNNNEVWNDIKSGKIQGFSIEGWFNKTPVLVKGQYNKVKNNNTKFKKMKKDGFFARIFGAKALFGTAVTVDGIEVSWDGDLMEGIEAFITDEAGEKMLAPEGDHSWENEDGSMTVITVDGNGIITGIQEVEPTPAEDEESAVDAEMKEVEEAMRKILKDSEMRFTAVEADNAELKSTIEKMETQIKQLCTELDAYVDGGQKFKRKEQSGERDWKKFSK